MTTTAKNNGTKASRDLMIAEALKARNATFAEMTDMVTSGAAGRNPERFADLADSLGYYNRLLANLGHKAE